MTSNFVEEVCGNLNLSCDECVAMVTSRATVETGRFSRVENRFVGDFERRAEGIGKIVAAGSCSQIAGGHGGKRIAVGSCGASDLETF